MFDAKAEPVTFLHLLAVTQVKLLEFDRKGVFDPFTETASGQYNCRFMVPPQYTCWNHCLTSDAQLTTDKQQASRPLDVDFACFFLCLK